jgi:hypothetical protein
LRGRRLAFGLVTLLGLGQRGWFIPARHAGDARPPALYAAMAGRMAEAEPAFSALLDAIDGFADELLAIGADPPPAPRWTQDWFPRLDAAAYYALLRTRTPARVVEVGAGHSTRFAARAIADAGLATDHRAIDPAPRADLARLPVRLDKRVVQQAGASAFADLAAGDVLFIDSSHVLMPGSDVDLLFAEVLPALPGGTLVHVHDVFLPDPYPASWTWRGYNEQNAVAALLASGGWRVLWSSRWVATRMADRLARSVAARLKLPKGAFETSLWLEKV